MRAHFCDACGFHVSDVDVHHLQGTKSVNANATEACSFELCIGCYREVTEKLLKAKRENYQKGEPKLERNSA